jgi:GNAT superfamily N-acetyltransferase
MGMSIRPATADDIGRIAYLVLQWNFELPEHLQRVEGGAPHAQRIAEVVVGDPRFVTRLLEVEDEVVGGICLHLGSNLFSLSQHGQLMMWYVDPKHRGGLHGLRLLKDAIRLADELKLGWLEIYPWADDTGASRVLERLGFHHGVNMYYKRITPWAKEAWTLAV